MLSLIKVADNELNLKNIAKNYPKKAIGLFRIYEWL